MSLEKEHISLKLDMFDSYTRISETVISETIKPEKSRVEYPKGSYYLLIYLLENSE